MDMLLLQKMIKWQKKIYMLAKLLQELLSI